METPRGFNRVSPSAPVTVQPRTPQRATPVQRETLSPRTVDRSPITTPRVDKAARGTGSTAQGLRGDRTINRTPLSRVPDSRSGFVTPRKGFADDARGGFRGDGDRSYERFGRDRDWDGRRAHRWDGDRHDGYYGRRHHGHHGHYGYGSWYGYGRHCYSPYRYGYRSCYPSYGYGYYYPYGIYASLYLGSGYGYYDGFYGYNRTYDIYDYEPYPATYTTYNTTVYESVPAQTQTYTESYVTPSTTQSYPAYESAPSSVSTLSAPVQAPTETYTAPAPTADPTVTPPPTATSTEQAQYKEPADVRAGHEHFAKGEYADAQASFLRAVLADDKDPYARLFYSMATVATADYPTAATSIRSALELAPDLISEPIDLRQFYKDEETLKSHLAGLTFWVESRTDGAEARLLLAYLMFATGDVNGADAELARIPSGSSVVTLVDQLRSSVSRVQQSISQKPASTTAPANP